MDIETDISDLAEHLKISQDEFVNQYLKKNEEGHFIFKEEPCPFLANNSCTVYEKRPEDCRSFPHLHKPEFRSRLISVITNSASCPIVFNVYEELKRTLRD
jgi:Fe-S-cluster containining protein